MNITITHEISNFEVETTHGKFKLHDYIDNSFISLMQFHSSVHQKAQNGGGLHQQVYQTRMKNLFNSPLRWRRAS